MDIIRNLIVVTFVFVAVQHAFCGPLLDAFKGKDYETATELCEGRDEIPPGILNEADENGDTSLHLAAACIDPIGTTWKLLMKYPLLNVRNGKGRTAIDVAVAFDNDLAFEWLANWKADLTNVDEEGNTLAHHAAAANIDDQVFRLLDFKKVSLEAENKAGERPLVLAAKLGNLGAIRSLLKYGVVVDALDREENTALHWAVRCQRDDVEENAPLNWEIRKKRRLCVRELLAKGKASPEIKNKDGLTAVMLAQQGKDEEIYNDIIAYQNGLPFPKIPEFDEIKNDVGS